MQIEPEALANQVALVVFRFRARLRLESAGVTMPWSHAQLSTIYRLLTDGPLPVSELAKLEHVRKQSMAQTVTGLINGGLVVSTPDPTDGRKAQISATPKARRIVMDIVSVRDAWLAETIRASLSPSERSLLLRAMEILNRIADLDVERVV